VSINPKEEDYWPITNIDKKHPSNSQPITTIDKKHPSNSQPITIIDKKHPSNNETVDLPLILLLHCDPLWVLTNE
jgi:hypothetical protein